jgi:hypothetical protein
MGSPHDCPQRPGSRRIWPRTIATDLLGSLRPVDAGQSDAVAVPKAHSDRCEAVMRVKRCTSERCLVHGKVPLKRSEAGPEPSFEGLQEMPCSFGAVGETERCRLSMAVRTSRAEADEVGQHGREDAMQVIWGSANEEVPYGRNERWQKTAGGDAGDNARDRTLALPAGEPRRYSSPALQTTHLPTRGTPDRT